MRVQRGVDSYIAHDLCLRVVCVCVCVVSAAFLGQIQALQQRPSIRFCPPHSSSSCVSTPGRASQVMELHDYTSIYSSALSEVVALLNRRLAFFPLILKHATTRMPPSALPLGHTPNTRV